MLSNDSFSVSSSSLESASVSNSSGILFSPQFHIKSEFLDKVKH